MSEVATLWRWMTLNVLLPVWASCFSQEVEFLCPHISLDWTLPIESSPSTVLGLLGPSLNSPGSFHLPPFGTQLLWDTEPCEGATWRRSEVLHLTAPDQLLFKRWICQKVHLGFSLRWIENLSEVLDQPSSSTGSEPSWIYKPSQQSRSPGIEWPRWVSHPIGS